MSNKKINSKPISFDDALPKLEEALVEQVRPRASPEQSNYAKRDKERYTIMVHSDARHKVSMATFKWAESTGKKPVKLAEAARALFSAVADSMEHFEHCESEEEFYELLCERLKG